MAITQLKKDLISRETINMNLMDDIKRTQLEIQGNNEDIAMYERRIADLKAKNVTLELILKDQIREQETAAARYRTLKNSENMSRQRSGNY